MKTVLGFMSERQLLPVPARASHAAAPPTRAADAQCRACPMICAPVCARASVCFNWQAAPIYFIFFRVSFRTAAKTSFIFLYWRFWGISAVADDTRKLNLSLINCRLCADGKTVTVKIQ